MSSLSNPTPGFCPIITLVHLYPQEMSHNGDRGNVLVLQRRMQWRGIPFELVEHHPGDPLPQNIDLIVGGGPQIAGASSVRQDLLRNKELLHECVEAGTAALLIGGSFQLFGNYIELISGETIEGLGIFNMHTVNGGQRFSGNVVATSEIFETIVGFENHSAKTYLSAGLSPLAQVTTGAGNNGVDKTEGARYRHAIGSYLQGPLLPKNPAIADYLIANALEHRLGEIGEMGEMSEMSGLGEQGELIKPGETAGLGEPGQAVGPGGPGETVGLGEPGQAVGPGDPGETVGPGGPVGPVEPGGPIGPVGPRELSPLSNVDDCAARAAVIALTRPR